jgi:hypothetical protein
MLAPVLLRRVFLLHLAMLSTASGEQWLKCVSQIAHQMKTIGNLHGLGSRFARGCCVICPTIAASAPQFPDVGVTTLQRLHWSDLVTNRSSFFAQDRLKWFRIGGPSSNSNRPRPGRARLGGRRWEASSRDARRVGGVVPTPILSAKRVPISPPATNPIVCTSARSRVVMRA